MGNWLTILIFYSTIFIFFNLVKAELNIRI